MTLNLIYYVPTCIPSFTFISVCVKVQINNIAYCC